jgi:TetR/AcrR family transcriptional regulator, cholesterol catabolism regulator
MTSQKVAGGPAMKAKTPVPRALPARTARAAGTTAPPNGDGNRRADLVRAAAKLFRQKGFEGTTTRDIADAVKMRSGSPFYHFANKQEILVAVVEEGLRQGLERTEHATHEGLNTRERFRQLIHTHFGILHDAGSDFIPVMLYDWRSLPADKRRKIIALKDRYDAIWQQTLDDLHREGALRGDPKLARLLILGAMNFSATWYRSSGTAAKTKPGLKNLQTLAEETAAFFLQAID